MLPDETREEYEERIRNKRTNVLLRFLVDRLEDESEVKFSGLVKNNKRRQVTIL